MGFLFFLVLSTLHSLFSTNFVARYVHIQIAANLTKRIKTSPPSILQARYAAELDPFRAFQQFFHPIKARSERSGLSSFMRLHRSLPECTNLYANAPIIPFISFSQKPYKTRRFAGSVTSHSSIYTLYLFHGTVGATGNSGQLDS